MTDRTPAPGSPWSKHCPEAWPREWLDASRELPTGFTRPADPLEADLITGRLTEAAFLHTTGRGVSRAATPSSRSEVKRKPNPVVAKVLGYRRLLDGLPTLEPRLSPGAVVVWFVLWTLADAGKGYLVRTSERRLSARLDVTRDTIRKRLGELEHSRFIKLARRGMHGRYCTVYRMRPTPFPRATEQMNRTTD